MRLWLLQDPSGPDQHRVSTRHALGAASDDGAGIKAQVESQRAWIRKYEASIAAQSQKQILVHSEQNSQYISHKW